MTNVIRTASVPQYLPFYGTFSFFFHTLMVAVLVAHWQSTYAKCMNRNPHLIKGLGVASMRQRVAPSQLISIVSHI